MKPATFELMKTAARTLLAHVDAGRRCDPQSVAWARQLLAQNPHPIRLVHATDHKPQEVTK